MQCGGPQASALMRRLVLDPRGRGVDVILVRDQTQDAEDRYGRRLAYVDLTEAAATSASRSSKPAGRTRSPTTGAMHARSAMSRRAAGASQRRGIWALCRR